MIDFKYHVVSLIAVFLAIALGIIIGTTALNGGIVNNLQSNVSELRADKRDLENRVNGLNTQIENNSEFDAAVAGQLVEGTLTGQNFVVITVGSSVTAELRDPVIQMLQTAGASNTGSISLTDAYSDPEQADQLLNYASNDPPPGISLPESSNAGEVTGALLAAMLVAPQGGTAQPAASIQTVLSGLGGLGVLNVDSTDLTPASNFVIVTSGAAPSPAGDRNDAVLALAMALDEAGGRVVIAGDLDSAGKDGLIAASNADAAASSSISTVNTAPTASGQVNVAWALIAEGNGTSGRYGALAEDEPIAPTP
ncbi:copper transporter [Epidermidibacterium keratini]|uniref:Copper transporter n=1 Tax=Epidermidibacterium keratini TaxID=1891644 RepID=A0A7L4YH52_9ACTN|nr:copper transporter [Epidermidibacterium keratini]QHB98934.1 copper transporter [Epidermidibacterium keratini]